MFSDRAAFLLDRADWDGAMADATEAIRLNPDDANAYYNRAVARENKGDVDEAIADYTRGRDLAPDDPSYDEALQRLGQS